MSDLQIAMRAAKVDCIRATRRFGTFAVLTVRRTIEKIRAGKDDGLRHPTSPGLSLSSIRLVIPDDAMGLPVFAYTLLCTCCRHYPGAASAPILRSLTQTYQPSPKGLSGRPAHRPFRSLLSVHSRCGQHTRAVTSS
jgi:hypothetical protein